MIGYFCFSISMIIFILGVYESLVTTDYAAALGLSAPTLQSVSECAPFLSLSLAYCSL